MSKTATLNTGASLPFYHNFFFASDRGGVGKTTSCVMLIAQALLCGVAVRGFELDQQNRLELMYPDLVTRLTLPDSETLRTNDTAKSVSLAKVLRAVRAAPDEGLVFVDIGANHTELVASTLGNTHTGDRIKQAGRRSCVLIPLDSSTDTIISAARAAKLFEAGMPDAEVYFVQRARELFVDLREGASLGQEARLAYTNTILPILKKREPFVIGTMRPTAMRAFQAANTNPISYLQLKPELVGSYVSAAGEADAWEFIGEELQEQFAHFLSKLEEEAFRAFGFRGVAPATAE